MKIDKENIENTYTLAERGPFVAGKMHDGRPWIFDKDGLMLCDGLDDFDALAKLATAGAGGYVAHKRIVELDRNAG